MAIKYKIETSEYDALDDSAKANYVERDGKYTLDLEDNDVEKTMSALQKDRDVVKTVQHKNKEWEKKFNDELAKLEQASKSRLEKGNTQNDSDDKDIETIIEKRVNAKMFKINEELEEVRSQNSASESQLKAMRKKEKSLLLKEGLNDIVSKNPKFNASATKFLHKLGVSELEYDSDRSSFANETFSSLEDWVDSQAVEYPMLYKPSIGAGATGGKDGVKKTPSMRDKMKEMFDK